MLPENADQKFFFAAKVKVNCFTTEVRGVHGVIRVPGGFPLMPANSLMESRSRADTLL
jgi:hypothetical protein